MLKIKNKGRPEIVNFSLPDFTVTAITLPILEPLAKLRNNS